jgi:hypothetical protein
MMKVRMHCNLIYVKACFNKAVVIPIPKEESLSVKLFFPCEIRKFRFEVSERHFYVPTTDLIIQDCPDCKCL